MALCLTCRSVSMTEVMSCADPAVVGRDQYPLPHCDWERCCLLKRFCMPWGPAVLTAPSWYRLWPLGGAAADRRPAISVEPMRRAPWPMMIAIAIPVLDG